MTSHIDAADVCYLGLSTLGYDRFHLAGSCKFIHLSPRGSVINLIFNLDDIRSCYRLTQMELDSLICKCPLGFPHRCDANAACVDAEVSIGCSLVHASPVIIVVYILLAICETSMFFYV